MQARSGLTSPEPDLAATQDAIHAMATGQVPELELLRTRTSAPIRQLAEPGPNDATLARLVGVATRVPDHGALKPWRIIAVRGAARTELGELFARIALRREPEIAPQRLELYRQLPAAAPLLLVVVSSLKPSKVPAWEQLLSAGALCQNLLLGAHALGFAGQWVTGWAARDAEVNAAFDLRETEEIVGFIYIGTPTGAVNERVRPAVADVLSHWRGDRTPISK